MFDQTQDVGPAQVLRLVGDMDIVEAGLVRRLLLLYVNATDAPAVVVDLSAVSFMDCAGLEPLLTADRWLGRRNRRLLLGPLSAPVKFLFAGLRRAGLNPPFDREEGPQRARYDDLSGPVDGYLDQDDARDQVGAAEAEQLRVAVDGRPLVDQATGLLMGFHGCDGADARELLTRVSRQHNMTVDCLAAGLAGLAAARGGRSTLDLSPAIKEAVRGVLAQQPRSPAARPSSSPTP
jgi:anti-anti-sigma factor